MVYKGGRMRPVSRNSKRRGGSGGCASSLRCLFCCFCAPSGEGAAEGQGQEMSVVSSRSRPRDSGAPLLGPRHARDKGKKCLVLDLDETLVHSSFRPVPGADFVVAVEIENMTHQVYVLKRPGVDEFLLQMAQHYEIVVFTASLAKYADPVLDILDIHNVVRGRLFRDGCDFIQGTYVKNMNRLGRPLPDAIIVDNSPTSYMLNPENAVPIGSWFDDANDNELLDLVPFLEALSKVEDVRKVLDEDGRDSLGSPANGGPSLFAPASPAAGPGAGSGFTSVSPVNR